MIEAIGDYVLSPLTSGSWMLRNLETSAIEKFQQIVSSYMFSSAPVSLDYSGWNTFTFNYWVEFHGLENWKKTPCWRMKFDIGLLYLSLSLLLDYYFSILITSNGIRNNRILCSKVVPCHSNWELYFPLWNFCMIL